MTFIPLVDPDLENLYRRSLIAGEYWASTGEKMLEARATQDRFAEALNARLAEAARLDALINNPHTDNFLEAVRLEAAHQRGRWGTEGDAGKTDADWLWLLGYLVGKAVHKPEKQLHHIITTAAACLNWHAMRAGVDSAMRPGIKEPLEYNDELSRAIWLGVRGGREIMPDESAPE